MKPTTEIAEGLAEKTAISWSCSDGPATSINSFILKEIPLLELLEVARAAKSINFYRNEELETALSKLREKMPDL